MIDWLGYKWSHSVSAAEPVSSASLPVHRTLQLCLYLVVQSHKSVYGPFDYYIGILIVPTIGHYYISQRNSLIIIIIIIE